MNRKDRVLEKFQAHKVSGLLPVSNEIDLPNEILVLTILWLLISWLSLCLQFLCISVCWEFRPQAQFAKSHAIQRILSSLKH